MNWTVKPGLQVSLYFLHFFNSPIFPYIVQKCPTIPIILLRIKRKKEPFITSLVNFVHVDVTEKGNEFPGPSKDQTSNYS